MDSSLVDDVDSGVDDVLDSSLVDDVDSGVDDVLDSSLDADVDSSGGEIEESVEESVPDSSIEEDENDDFKATDVDSLISNLIGEELEDDSADDSETGSELETENSDSQSTSAEKSNDVDSLISDIIHEEDRELSVVVNNVSLSFDVANDKIDNLKELFIRTLKRNKAEKQRFQALKNISFEIYKGEKIGVIGYNGAGKSTLLNVITGIYPPEEGTVETYGKISPLLALGAGFDHNYSGRENIYLNGAVLGYSKEFLQSKFDEIVEFSELEDFIDFPIKNYSSGMLAKLGFSIATIVEPDILIIDEVLGVGDVNFQKKSSDKIRSLMDSGTTVILVSHSIPQIRQLCDKAIWIDQGRVREIGEVNEVCNNYLKDAEKADKEQLKNIRFR
ncbi:ABC transporter ATP-binding protein [uncultured Methanobrevibacter sp.]|uniref:ABC transporter ATP-binding protein n=1 Tax=uncultured Methanobrevibacter sp. TaxID=253161 RepID=UPI002604678D